jgi:hypothetical protein
MELNPDAIIFVEDNGVLKAARSIVLDDTKMHCIIRDYVLQHRVETVTIRGQEYEVKR